MRLQDRVYLITGSTTGIGRAIARLCLDEGGLVMIHGMDEAEAEEVREDLCPDRSAAGHVCQDLREKGAAAKMIQATLDEFGRLDGLVNNAAQVWFGGMAAVTEDRFDEVLAVNLRAPLFLIQAAIPHLAARRGNVVNIGSINAHCGEPDLLPYSLSKGGLMTLTRNLGDTLHREHGICVNQVNPGWVFTENEDRRKREQGMSEGWESQLSPREAPSGRLLRAEEVAEAVVYFLSEEKGPVSGSVLDLEQFPVIGRNPPKG
ncbi:MAG: SDR family oxidoreductase [Verrucomicrobiota bacterium]